VKIGFGPLPVGRRSLNAAGASGLFLYGIDSDFMKVTVPSILNLYLSAGFERTGLE
jgi:hypothetical protein